MSIAIMSLIFKAQLGSPSRKMLAVRLADFADDEGRGIWPTVGRLAQETELSERTVQRLLREFVEEGLLVVVAEGGGRPGQATRYDFDIRSIKRLKDAKSSADGCHGVTGDTVTPVTLTTETGDIDGRDGWHGVTQTVIEPSDNRKQPRANAGKPVDDLFVLQSKLTTAAGDKIQPHGVFDLSAIIGLISAGVDLETDILPTIRARAATMQRPAKGWNYFTDAIKDAHNRRIKAGEGLAKPVKAVTPDTELAPDVLDAEWTKRLGYARRNASWISAAWGPMPGDDGCRVPSNLLQPTDGKDRYGNRWDDQSKRAA